MSFYLFVICPFCLLVSFSAFLSCVFLKRGNYWFKERGGKGSRGGRVVFVIPPFSSFCGLSFCHSICLFSLLICLFLLSFAKLLKRGNYRLKERGGGGLRSSRVVAKIRFRTFLLRRRTSAPVRCGHQVSQNILFFFNQVWILFVFSMGLVEIYLTMFISSMPAPSYHWSPHRLGGEETLALYKNNMAKMQIFPSFGFEKNILRLVFEKKQKRFR